MVWGGCLNNDLNSDCDARFGFGMSIIIESEENLEQIQISINFEKLITQLALQLKVDIEESVQDSVKLNGLAQRIVVRRLDNQKTLAYVALGKRGLHILNVTDIKNIIVNQNLTGITEAIDIALDENNWLYVSDEYIGLHVFEDAKNLDTIGNYSPSNFISRPTVAFSVSSTSKRADLYVVDGLNHAMVLKQDLESKTPWQLIGNWRTVGVVESAIFFRTDSKGTIATANGQNGLEKVEIDH